MPQKYKNEKVKDYSTPPQSHVLLINFPIHSIYFTCCYDVNIDDLFIFVFLLFPIEILQSSRYSRMTQSFIGTEDSEIYQNMGNEDLNRVNRDINDVLGPLPNIPIISTTQDSDKNWSRRMSGMSGIYEEITDPCHR